MLSVVCPVYNEAENIERLMDALQTSISVPLELLIVYDYEEDNTVPRVNSLAAHYPFQIRLLRNQFGTGGLSALRTGFMESQGEAVLVVMADLSDDFSVVDEMYRLVTTNGYDIVCGSRYMSEGKHIGGSWVKKSLSRLVGLSLHYLTGLPTHDVTNAFKMYRRQFLNGVKIESRGGFEIGMELVVKAFLDGAKITELPATWRDRSAGKSRFRLWRWAPHYLRWYLYALSKWWRRQPGKA